MPGSSSRPRRNYNVFDAVAGRVTTNESSRNKNKTGLVPSAVNHDSLAARRLAPEDVLFRRQDAPARYAERDIYWANEWQLLQSNGLLPDSDLLKCLHSYASRFYQALEPKTRREGQKPRLSTGGATPGDAGGEAGEGTGEMESSTTASIIDQRSMDETALLAFGILLEEAGRSLLGEEGDLAFVDGVRDGDADEEDGIRGEKRQEESDVDMWSEEDGSSKPKPKQI